MICFHSLINLHLTMNIYAHNVETRQLFAPSQGRNLFMEIEMSAVHQGTGESGHRLDDF